MEDITNQNTFDDIPSNQNFSINLSLTDMKGFTGWATFKAVMDIITGALACLGIITAAYGVPQIMAGVKLLAAIDELKRYISSNDVQKISTTFYNMNKYFKLSGISIIVKICFVIIGIILYGVLIAFFISNMPDFFNNMDYYGNF